MTNPALAAQPTNWLLVIAVILLAALLLYVWLGVAQPAKRLADMIHQYLGTNRGNPATWTGFIGNMTADNERLKDRINKIDKDVCILQGNPEAQCPPGGPADSPVRPPNYPP